MSEITSLSARRWAKDSDPNKFTPREVIVEALRQLDAGEVEAEHVIVVHGWYDPAGVSNTGYFQGGEFRHLEGIGLLHRAIALMTMHNDE